MSEPTKLRIELWDADDIKPYAKNAKKHPTEQVEALAAAIREYGHDQPIVVDADGVIIKGHGRRLAVIFNRDHHGGPRKAPVIVRRDLTKHQADAARLSDNRVTSTDYDHEAQTEEMRRLLLEDDLRVVGFTEKEYEFLNADDLTAFNADAFVEDISGAVEDQKDANAAKEIEIDNSVEAPIGDALGFKKVTVEQSRKIRNFISKVEASHGLKGAEALIAHIDSLETVAHLHV